MKKFAQLFQDLDQTNKTNEKVDILVEYLRNATDEDILWTLSLFTGRRPRRVVSSTLIRDWAAEYAGVPLWLFEESYAVVGDLSETISLLLPPPKRENSQSLGYWIRFMKAMENRTEAERKAAMFDAWDQMTPLERFMFSKITSHTFRVGVSQNLIVRALSLHTKIPGNVIAHRLMGKWDENTTTYQELLHAESRSADLSQPYPFYLAYALEDEPASLGMPEEWQAEWKWDGIRSQLIYREGHLFIWSRGEELVTDKFPELHPLKTFLPDGTVIDGEILPFADGQVLPFNVLQTRIGRKNVTPKVLKDAPVVIFAYDLLEWKGEDIRERPWIERNTILAGLVERINFKPWFQLSPRVEFETWPELAARRELSRNYLSEGIMLKRKTSHYGVGRRRGDWWKWKVDPFSIDAVLIYAQSGSGRRANLFTDYTFGIWKDGELVPFAKAYSGLTDKEIIEVDSWVKKNTIERFGPVRTVKPELVFEIGFEGLQRSNRHKSGVAVRFPRILRWRRDKPFNEADTIEGLRGLLEKYESGE